jgi:hypothetical protein
MGTASTAGGSIRDPAVAHGIFGFRPSHDGQDTPDAVLPCGHVNLMYNFEFNCIDTWQYIPYHWFPGAKQPKYAGIWPLLAEI